MDKSFCIGANVATPPCNTGSFLQVESPRRDSSTHERVYLKKYPPITASLDYIRVSHPDMSEDVFQMICDTISTEFFNTPIDFGGVHPGRCGRHFDFIASTECNGARAYWNVGESGLYDFMYQVSGKLLQTLSPSRVREFLQLLRGYGCKATRFDVANDDYGKTISPDQVLEAASQKNLKHFRKGRQVSGWGDDAGWCIYFGSRESDRFGRYYDKSVESNGAIDAYRWEAEFKGAHADMIFCRLADFEGTDSEWVGELSSAGIGIFDFIDRSADSNISRCPRLPWWDEFVKRFPGHVRYRVHRVVTTIQKTRQWAERSVSVAIATVREAMGNYDFNNWWNATLSKGSLRMSSKHYKRVEKYQAVRRSPQRDKFVTT